MGITAYFYQFEKKVNSTKQPVSMVPGDFAITVELKNVTNLFTPSLTLSSDRFMNGGAITNPMKFTYCYLPDFERYYFIRSWSWVLGRWECALEVDVLASFKSAIGETTAYILRSYSAYDGSIVDTKYPALSGASTLSNVISSMWKTDMDSSNAENGFFVIGVVNNDVNAVGVTSYYALSGQGMREFVSKLYASPAWMNITDASISTDLQKMLMNPIQYIVSCMWFPCAGIPTLWPQRGSTIPVGWWSITMTNPVYWLTGSFLTLSFGQRFDVPVHPQTSDAHLTWLKNSPYSQYQLQFYPFGVFPIDSAKLYGYANLVCSMTVDLVTGSAVLTVKRANGNTIYSDPLFSSSTMLAVPVSLAQMTVDMSRISNGMVWAGAAGLSLANAGFFDKLNEKLDNLDGLLSGRKLFAKPSHNFMTMTPAEREAALAENQASDSSSILGTVKQVAVDIGNAVLASSGVCSMVGTNGTLAQYTLDHILTLFYYRIPAIDPVHYGYPLCQSRKINTLSGFVLCANAGDFSPSCTQAEREAVVSLMQAGFFYE